MTDRGLFFAENLVFTPVVITNRRPSRSVASSGERAAYRCGSQNRLHTVPLVNLIHSDHGCSSVFLEVADLFRRRAKARFWRGWRSLSSVLGLS